MCSDTEIVISSAAKSVLFVIIAHHTHQSSVLFVITAYHTHKPSVLCVITAHRTHKPSVADISRHSYVFSSDILQFDIGGILYCNKKACIFSTCHNPVAERT